MRLFFSNKIQKDKIDRTTAQILELQSTKKELEIEIANQRQELDNERKRQVMKIEEEQHKHKLEMQSKDAEFARSKKAWEEDKTLMLKRFGEERTDFETRLKSEYDLKLQEAVTLAKLDAEQRVRQVELDKSRATSELESKYAKEKSELEQKLSQDYYSKLTAAMADFNANGNVTTKFMQEIAMKVFEKAPFANPNLQIAGSLKDFKEING